MSRLGDRIGGLVAPLLQTNSGEDAVYSLLTF
jgi:hypothetical protein